MAFVRAVTSHAELVSLIAEAGLPHTADPVAKTIDLPPASPEIPGPFHIRWQTPFPFVDFVQLILADVPATRIPDIETAIVRLNHVTPFPGLGLDHAKRAVYHRATAVVLVDGIRIDLIHVYLQGLQLSAKRLRPALQRVVDGMAGEAILTVA